MSLLETKWIAIENLRSLGIIVPTPQQIQDELDRTKAANAKTAKGIPPQGYPRK